MYQSGSKYHVNILNITLTSIEYAYCMHMQICLLHVFILHRYAYFMHTNYVYLHTLILRFHAICLIFNEIPIYYESTIIYWSYYLMLYHLIINVIVGRKISIKSIISLVWISNVMTSHCIYVHFENQRSFTLHSLWWRSFLV